MRKISAAIQFTGAPNPDPSKRLTGGKFWALFPPQSPGAHPSRSLRRVGYRRPSLKPAAGPADPPIKIKSTRYATKPRPLASLRCDYRFNYDESVSSTPMQRSVSPGALIGNKSRIISPASLYSFAGRKRSLLPGLSSLSSLSSHISTGRPQGNSQLGALNANSMTPERQQGAAQCARRNRENGMGGHSAAAQW
jgi:hypothetical protein